MHTIGPPFPGGVDRCPSPILVSTPPIPAAPRRAAQTAFAAALAFLVSAPARPLQAGSLFAAADVDLERFVLVAAPIGSGPRSQLNIYEQVSSRQPCFAVGQGKPAAVNPLLSTFDFTGICSRFIDANGYSLRIGGSDLATSYRLMVTRGNQDLLLLGIPTRSGAGPEMVVARTHGNGSGFLKLELEPGWTLKRRQYGSRKLGHLYLYRETWPGASDPTARSVVPAAEPLPAGQVPVESLPASSAPAVSPGPEALPTLPSSY
jgi:hypothetical protein